MKHLILALFLALVPSVHLPAQEPSPAPSVSTPAEAGTKKAGGARRKAALQSLTPEERQRLKAARKAAMDDPQVKALEGTRKTDRKGYRQAVQAAMLRIDPNVGSILSKVKAERKQDKVF